MKPVPLQSPWWSGHVPVAGCWRPANWPRPEILLEAWQAGSQIWRTEAPDGWLLVWPAAQSRNVAELPGWAVCRNGNLFLGTDLPSERRASLDQGLLLVHGDALCHLPLHPFDASTWVDLGVLAVWTEPQPVAVAALPAAPPPPSPAARPLFAKVPRASAGQEAVLRELNGAAAARERWWHRVGRWLGAIPLGGRVGTGRPAGSARAGPMRQGPGWWERLLGTLQRWSGLAGQVRRQHRRYFRELLDTLARRDWQQFLRHALPLDDRDVDAAPQSLMRLLSPRANLSFSAGNEGRSGSLAEDFFKQMQQHYRRVFLALDQAGQVDEAAFVLAELLRATDEAIAYLQKHGRHRTAAELASLRMLPPARQIGLWLAAGERERALAVALQHQAFQAAVQHFASDAGLLVQIRQLWGEHLLARGCPEHAVEVMWPAPALRPQLTELLVAVEEGSGAGNARLLARAAALLPERFQNQWPVFQRLWSTDDPGRALLQHFARTLVQSPATPATRLFARESLRALWLDGAVASDDAGLCEQLRRHADDPYLNADQPIAAITPAVRPEPDTPVVLADGPRGSLDIRALAVAGDDRLLVGLGEDGCLLLAADGQVRQRWRVPAGAFVVDGGAALGLAIQRRERRLLAVTVLDLAQSRVRDSLLWPVHACALNLVDGLWAIAPDDGLRIQLLDMGQARPQAIWDSGPLPAPVRQLAFAEGGVCALLGGHPEPLQLWRWRWPGLALASRDILETEWSQDCLLPESAGSVLGLDYTATATRLERLTPGRPLQTLWPDSAGQALPGGCVTLLQLGGGLLQVEAERGLTVHPETLVLDPQQRRILLRRPGDPSHGHDLAADDRSIWVAREGAVARWDRRTGVLRWLVPA